MSFDLNIDNYTRPELIEMFELPEHFDRNIVEIKEARLRDSIINNKQIKKDTQIQTINFLTKAKNIILNDQKQQKQQNTTFQQKIEDFYNSSYELKTSKLEDQQEHMIQVRAEKPYLSSFPSEFFPGIINPLKKRTIKKNLNIDTRFRDNYYANSSTNFNISLPTNFNDVVQMQLASIELPTTFYSISKQYGNNYFTIIVNLSDGTSDSKVINIPDGNYTQQTIMEIINTQLSLSGEPFSYISFIVNLSGAHTGSAQTLVGLNTTYPSAPTPSITSFELNFQYDRFGIDDKNTPLPLKFGWVLGFRNGVYVGNLNYVSEGVVDTTGPKYLYLVVDDYNNNVNNGFFSAFNSSILNKNILARISMQASTFNILEQNNLNVVTTPRDYFGPININNLTIQLLDEYGRIVDLNNMDYSFCLNLTTVYDI
jgi:hypothetical protein